MIGVVIRPALVVGLAFGLGFSARAGELPASEPYVEIGGRVPGEAENFHARTAGPAGEQWTESAGMPFSSARSGAYLRVLPDTPSGFRDFSGANGGARVEYNLWIRTPGLYRLFLRWDGVDMASDSIFAGIVELADGAGGTPDWYEDTDHRASNFATDPWDGLGGAEQNQAIATQNPMTWRIETPGAYTLRIVAREDGAALDAWVLQLATRSPPAGDEPPVLRPDGMTMHLQGTAGIAVLQNDDGLFRAEALSVASPPAHGAATATTNGTIVYRHTTGSPASDEFTYSVPDISGASAGISTVSIAFASSPRIANTTVTMPVTPPPVSYSVVDALPGVTFTAPTSMESPPGDSNRLYVAERSGQIWVVTNVAATSPQRSLFLDLSSRVENDGNELGFKGLAFHPGFHTNRQFFVTYCTLTNGVRFVRLSRFTTQPGNPNVADASSEFVLISQTNDGTVHNIDDIAFGPDGYLFLGIGDEGGNQVDSFNNSQTITKDLWSGLLRIDVDKRPGSLAPNPHPAIRTDAGIARFAIPPDNPFIGATQFNGAAINPANVRTEFYAVGMRNPWQFSFDSATGDLWLGDVGNEAWEEVHVVTAGANLGWAFYEGDANGPRFAQKPANFSYHRAVWIYPHGNSTFAGFSVTAGLVVRGDRYPELLGRFLCSDYVSGNIWTVERAPGATNVARIAGEGGIVQFGLDPSNGDILMLDHGDGRVRRLVRSQADDAFPQLLSDTGFYADLTDLAPNPGVVPYDVNLPFWSDHAIKHRLFVITNDTDRVVFAAEDTWASPLGMMWLKHFDFETDRGNPASRKRLETRVIVRNSNGIYGVSYRWNDDGTEALLAPAEGVNFDIALTNAGIPATQTWRIPSRAECLICHAPALGGPLSFNTRQMNRAGALAGATGNFLTLLADAGYVSNAVPDPFTLPRHVGPGEIEYSLTARARAYLAVNCAYCHQPAVGTAPATWDARANLTLDATRLIRGLASQSGASPSNRLVLPGSVGHSIVWNRIAGTNGFTRMPPLATFVTDDTNIALIAAWIAQDLPAWQSYNEWRLANFGSTNSLDGAPDADPDGDDRNNREEFLTRTEPTNAFSRWTGFIGYDPAGPAVGHDLAGRPVVIETSTNLADWTRWPHAANDGIPRAAPITLPISATNTETFYRFLVGEE